MELRRKLHDSQAVLHELGKENQALQVGSVQRNSVHCKISRDISKVLLLF